MARVIGEVLVIGEALIDVVKRPGRPTEMLPGGSPLNVAIGLQRLGVPTLIHSSFGRDAFGDLLASHLDRSGVRTSASSRTNAPTSSAEARIQADGSASYVFDLAWDVARLPFPRQDFAAVHSGSIAAVLEPGASVVEDEIDLLRHVATITFDPNIRPQLMGSPTDARKRVERMVARADVVKASNEDLSWLYPSVDVWDSCKRWLDLGPSLVVVTRGVLGARALTRAGKVTVPVRPVSVVDTVGAGDSFMAAVIAGLADRHLLGRRNAARLRSLDLETTSAILEFATLCATLTVGRQGANPPTRAELASRTH